MDLSNLKETIEENLNLNLNSNSSISFIESIELKPEPSETEIDLDLDLDLNYLTDIYNINPLETLIQLPKKKKDYIVEKVLEYEMNKMFISGQEEYKGNIELLYSIYSKLPSRIKETEQDITELIQRVEYENISLDFDNEMYGEYSVYYKEIMKKLNTIIPWLKDNKHDSCERYFLISVHNLCTIFFFIL